MIIALQIETKRKQMIRCAKEYGFTATETVKCSQELDALLNKQWNQQLRSMKRLVTNEYSLAQ